MLADDFFGVAVTGDRLFVSGGLRFVGSIGGGWRFGSGDGGGSGLLFRILG